MSTTEPSKDDVAKSPDVEKAKDNANSVDGQELKFTPEEEEALVKESTVSKEEANTLFSAKKYQEALDKYDDAINSCPKYLHYPRAVIYSNIAACHIQLEDWKEAIKSASDSLKALEKLEQSDPRLSSDGKKSDEEKEKKEDDDVEEEIISSGASRAAPVPSADDGELKALRPIFNAFDVKLSCEEPAVVQRLAVGIILLVQKKTVRHLPPNLKAWPRQTFE
ncbi:hypothetical protein FOXB_07300 [Fusarium oxysporum f. sp. conglutinans Fo5176]|uniref:Uncharacterized protein n=1 Tax=Fusarium oxysporum (strain Fo5176) TaxID=660025 RepID=F9FLM0_FUSOF|nr:hypothetical protein FOXB_07300 [Fusarium oxysporum f. sp. conglutinans Fo5176]